MLPVLQYSRVQYTCTGMAIPVYCNVPTRVGTRVLVRVCMAIYTVRQNNTAYGIPGGTRVPVHCNIIIYGIPVLQYVPAAHSGTGSMLLQYPDGNAIYR